MGPKVTVAGAAGGKARPVSGRRSESPAGRPVAGVLGHEAMALVERLLERPARLLLLGAPGVGKSTLARDMAEALAEAGYAPRCLGADPGSPAFGPPGAVALAEWRTSGWSPCAIEALCSLDAGRFRLPLAAALARLARGVPDGATLLVDAPGVVRGVAAAELLPAMVEALGIELAVIVVRGPTAPPPLTPLPLGKELAALGLEAHLVPAASAARRPGKRTRARRRTRLWEAYLEHAVELEYATAALPVIGIPPPEHAVDAWRGRQAALLDAGGATLALGEITARTGASVRLRVRAPAAPPRALLVRDAGRNASGLIETQLAPGAAMARPPPDMRPPATAGDAGDNPRPVARIGAATAVLVNGVFGDPLLHVRLHHQRRSVLFDLGDAERLPARTVHQVSDVFVSHAHFDHIAGFLRLLRARIGHLPPCRLYGPPGLAGHIAGLVAGICWDRVGERRPRFEVAELHGRALAWFRVQAGEREPESLGSADSRGGRLREEPSFAVRAVALDHGTPVLAFAFETPRELKVRKERLTSCGLAPGPWLGELKTRLLAGEPEASLRLPDGRREQAGALAHALILERPGQKLVYATDLADTPANRARLVALATGAKVLFCEAPFVERDAEQARRTGHLTARACGEIAAAARVERLLPFHFSARYAGEPERIRDEVRAGVSAGVNAGVSAGVSAGVRLGDWTETP